MKLQVLDLQLYSKNSFANVLLFLLLLLVLLLLLFTLFLQLSLFLLLRKCSLLFFFNKSQNNKPCVDIIRYHTTMICEHDLTKLNEKLAKLFAFVCIIVFNTMMFRVILFIIKLFAGKYILFFM